MWHILSSEDIDDLISSLTLELWCMRSKHLRIFLDSLEQSLKHFGNLRKMFGNVCKASGEFLGNLGQAIGNRPRQIDQNVVFSVFI